MEAFGVKGRAEKERYVLEVDWRGYGDPPDTGSEGERSIKADVGVLRYGACRKSCENKGW